MGTELNRAVADAVQLVNGNAGQICVRLRFADDTPEIDFIANAARIEGSIFEFTAGYESYSGDVAELAHINAHVIQH